MISWATHFTPSAVCIGVDLANSGHIGIERLWLQYVACATCPKFVLPIPQVLLLILAALSTSSTSSNVSGFTDHGASGLVTAETG